MNTDSREAAEAFFEKVVATAREAPRADLETARARAELAREDLELVRRELVETGLDPERLDKLAAERSKGRKKLADDARRRAVDASDTAARRLAELTPVLSLPAEPTSVPILQVTFIRSFVDAGVVVDSISSTSTAGRVTGCRAPATG